jgi:DNA-binding YbaB/EbfC family protein
MENLAGLMQQASQMQAKIQDVQARLDALEIEGVAGAGLVRLILTGRGELKTLLIDPNLADPAEMETLQDLIMAAHADAKQKIEAITAAEMQHATGGLDLGLGGLKLPF